MSFLLSFFVSFSTLIVTYNYSVRYVKSYEEQQEFLNSPIDPRQKVAYLLTVFDLIWKSNNNKKIELKLCRERLKTDSVVIYYPKNFYLIKAIDRKIEKLIASGLIEHWVKTLVSLRQTVLRGINDPKPLSMSHLTGTFLVYLIGCLLSSTVFVFEITVRCARRPRRQWWVKN